MRSIAAWAPPPATNRFSLWVSSHPIGGRSRSTRSTCGPRSPMPAAAGIGRTVVADRLVAMAGSSALRQTAAGNLLAQTIGHEYESIGIAGGGILPGAGVPRRLAVVFVRSIDTVALDEIVFLHSRHRLLLLLLHHFRR